MTVAEGFHPGSEVANMSVLGYNLPKVYEGRGPLEAASIGVGFFFLGCIVSVLRNQVLIPDIFLRNLLRKGLENANLVGILIKP